MAWAQPPTPGFSLTRQGQCWVPYPLMSLVMTFKTGGDAPSARTPQGGREHFSGVGAAFLGSDVAQEKGAWEGSPQPPLQVKDTHWPSGCSHGAELGRIPMVVRDQARYDIPTAPLCHQ